MSTGSSAGRLWGPGQEPAKALPDPSTMVVGLSERAGEVEKRRRYGPQHTRHITLSLPAPQGKEHCLFLSLSTQNPTNESHWIICLSLTNYCGQRDAVLCLVKARSHAHLQMWGRNQCRFNASRRAGKRCFSKEIRMLLPEGGLGFVRQKHHRSSTFSNC